MKQFMRGIGLVLLLSGATWAHALEGMEETITIHSDKDVTYYEYRVNGEISEIKVVPRKGPAYYLVPSQQEDGEFVRKDNPRIRVPSWVIFRW